MAPEDAAAFEELRERAYRSGATSVSVPKREPRFHMMFESCGWERSFYGKTLQEVYRSVGIFLDERGFA
jgi:hypothetical protein